MTSGAGIFVGVNISGGQKPHAYVALDDGCKIVAVGKGRRKDLLAFLAGLSQARVALNGPAAPQQWEFKTQPVDVPLFPLANLNRAGLAVRPEMEVTREDVRVERTLVELSRCPGWMRNGFSLWQVLLEWGFQRYPAEDSPRIVIETRSQVGFALLLGNLPYPENTLEGRMQRQMALCQQHLPVADPMDVLEEITPHRLISGKLPLEKIYQPDDLNAWLAAWIAWLTAHQPDRTSCWGAVEDGVMILPERKALPGSQVGG